MAENTQVDAKVDVKKLSFERAIEELESIVTRLEAGKVPLEESVAIYERGEALKRRCEELLRQAEARVDKITTDAERPGRPAPSRSTFNDGASPPRAEIKRHKTWRRGCGIGKHQRPPDDLSCWSTDRCRCANAWLNWLGAHDGDPQCRRPANRQRNSPRSARMPPIWAKWNPPCAAKVRVLPVIALPLSHL